MIYRLISPPWATHLKKVLEGQFTDDQIADYNIQGYNIYFLPNHPRIYQPGIIVDGSHIDTFEYIFVDCDLKDKHYQSKDEFLEVIGQSGIEPTMVVDSGNGMHVYWRVNDLSAASYLRFQKRLIRLFNTDDSVWTIFQLMRVPGTLNTKVEDNYLECTLEFESNRTYSSEELNSLLPPISIEDESSCEAHFQNTYNPRPQTAISEALPPKFGKLLSESPEVKDLFAGDTPDRSKADYRLGHVMYASGFNRDEALSVLINSVKALTRSPIHRHNYAVNIVDKIWTYEQAEDKSTVNLSPTVREILSKGEDTIAGTRFPCHRLVDDTQHGFRLGQVIGIVGGSGVGKTTLTLNMFLWFAANNPSYHHFFISLEQPSGEIASRIRTICGDNDALYDKIHIISNYSEDGTYLHHSLKSIEEHLLDFKAETGFAIGATVIDHIGVLDKNTKNGEADGIIGICRSMKALAQRLNTMLIMLSQAPREKAGVGDLELNKDAAYGTVFFESFVDYLLTIWQPLKRVYGQSAPTVMAFKFAKIRHKKQNTDTIKEDICYQVFFDPETERLREMTQEEEIAAKFFVGVATNLRKADKKTDIVPYQSRRTGEASEAAINRR